MFCERSTDVAGYQTGGTCGCVIKPCGGRAPSSNSTAGGIKNMVLCSQDGTSTETKPIQTKHPNISKHQKNSGGTL